MLCIYRKKTIKFEEREKNVTWSDQEPEDHGDDIKGPRDVVLKPDGQNALREAMYVDLNDLFW